MHTSNMTNQTMTIKIQLKYVLLVLLITNIVTVLAWKPWQDTSATVRKITVSGQATIKSTPDEFVLSPYFEYSNANRDVATKELTDQSATITTKLKELGVKDEQIKSNTNGYERYSSYPTPADNSLNALQLSYTITVGSKELAQSVQDYLLTLKPKGQISPQAQFSEAKKNELEEQARAKALEDAKAKADVTARQLNAKIGKVITFSEGAGYSVPMPYGATMMSDVKTSSLEVSSVAVQPGQDEFSYGVSVEYELK